MMAHFRVGIFEILEKDAKRVGFKKRARKGRKEKPRRPRKSKTPPNQRGPISKFEKRELEIMEEKFEQSVKERDERWRSQEQPFVGEIHFSPRFFFIEGGNPEQFIDCTSEIRRSYELETEKEGTKIFIFDSSNLKNTQQIISANLGVECLRHLRPDQMEMTERLTSGGGKLTAVVVEGWGTRVMQDQMGRAALSFFDIQDRQKFEKDPPSAKEWLGKAASESPYYLMSMMLLIDRDGMPARQYINSTEIRFDEKGLLGPLGASRVDILDEKDSKAFSPMFNHCYWSPMFGVSGDSAPLTDEKGQVNSGYIVTLMMNQKLIDIKRDCPMPNQFSWNLLGEALVEYARSFLKSYPIHPDWEEVTKKFTDDVLRGFDRPDSGNHVRLFGTYFDHDLHELVPRLLIERDARIVVGLFSPNTIWKRSGTLESSNNDDNRNSQNTRIEIDNFVGEIREDCVGNSLEIFGEIFFEINFMLKRFFAGEGPWRDDGQ